MISITPAVHRYRFEELGIQSGPLFELMGYPGNQVPEPIPEMLDLILDEAPQHAAIQGGYVILDQFRRTGEQEIYVDGLDFRTGKTIAEHLRNAEQLAFFLITAGPEMEAWSRRMMESGDPMAAFMIDLLASETVDASMDRMEASLEQSVIRQGLSITNRYSPGYCGWPLEDQQKLFQLFPSGFCGISLSESSLMIPIKSVSGVIGIGSMVEKQGYTCQFCDMKDCFYRDRKMPA